MNYYNDLLMFIDNLRGHDSTALVDYQMLRRCADLVAKCISDLGMDIENVRLNKTEKKEEAQQELPIWKRFPVKLAQFECSHEFCKFMNFNKGRLSQLLGTFPDKFTGTFNAVKSKVGNRNHYYVEPEGFLAKLLEYPYRSPAERALVAQYKKEKQQNGSGG